MEIITENELKKYGKTFSLSKKALALINHQKANWPLASANYTSLRQVQNRSFNFGHFRIDCQFNPGRIRSSAANTDAKAIEARPCFLCEPNRPPQQTGIQYGNHYTILCNPFPIFPYHLTIPLINHEPQQLEGHIDDFLKLTHDLDEFVVFYNGPQCGASAPDHFHFQAGIRDVLPVEDEMDNLIAHHSDLLIQTTEIQIYSIENYLRRLIVFESTNTSLLSSWISKTMAHLSFQDKEGEPMVNILGYFMQGSWRVILFPRSAQRPREYFADDFERILVSPAAVELGGLIILPREEDFYKITADDLTSIYSQVTLQKNDFDELKKRLIENS